MVKERVKLKKILEEEEDLENLSAKEKKKFGLKEEEIEEIKEEDLENPAESEDDSSEFDEEEFEEDIGDFIPKTQNIKLESRLESLFSKRDEVEPEENEEDSEKYAKKGEQRKGENKGELNMEIQSMKAERLDSLPGKNKRMSLTGIRSMKKGKFLKDTLGWEGDRKNDEAKYEGIVKRIIFPGLTAEKKGKNNSNVREFEGSDYDNYYGYTEDTNIETEEKENKINESKEYESPKYSAKEK